MRVPFCRLALLLCLAASRSDACCAVSARGVPAVNADQTVILLWDQERQTEHFIRQASFRSGGESVGFLVPTPGRPQLEESGNQAFPYLAQITAPKAPVSVGLPIGCSSEATSYVSRGVQVIEEKTVAGYHAVVLAADSGKALTQWLRDHGYDYTPEAAAWAQPYLEARWYMTAMKIARESDGRPSAALAASALRISFQTDRPLFPYREPDSREAASRLGVSDRLLRIYFVAESRYEGRFPSGSAWSGRAKWSQRLEPGQRSQLLQDLALPESTGPSQFWLTEFDDHWPYGQAPGDVYFSASASQRTIGRMGGATGMGFDPTFVVAMGAYFAWRRKRKA